MEMTIDSNTSLIIAIIGIGYVGYPLACLFSKNGYNIIGYDIDPKRVENINSKKIIFPDYIPDYDHFKATTNKEDLKNADVFIITVPTPLRNGDEPDLSYVESACKTIRANLSKGSLVILESTTYPGTTEELVKPILEQDGLKAGTDFYLCFSPERIDPGNKNWPIEKIPKVVGGINEESNEIACSLYEKVFEKIVPVSSAKVAEAAKILENVFRNVNIALMNETAIIFEKLGIDTWEVIKAASTKPYAFMPHYPGPGIGGHCIPLDPFYLSHRIKKSGMETKFIELAGKINREMPYHVVAMIKNAMKETGKDIQGKKISVLGVSYKKNISDTRESPARIIIQELLKETSNIHVFDPYTKETFGGKSEGFEEALKNADCIVLVVDHGYFRQHEIEKKILQFSPDCCVIDTRNFLEPTKLGEKIYYKCLGK